MQRLDNQYYSHRRSIRAILLVSLMLLTFVSARPQGIKSIDRERSLDMLSAVKNALKKDYYDPTFHGVDLDARFKNGADMIKQATSLGQAFGIIAQVLMGLDDSHTFFLPPDQTVRADYGWKMQAIGDKTYITAVQPGTDADAKGVKPGDEILAVNGVAPARTDIWKLLYLYNTLRPQPGLRLKLRDTNGTQRELDVMAKISKEPVKIDLTGAVGASDFDKILREISKDENYYRNRSVDLGSDVFVLKMSQFSMDSDQVDHVMDKAKQFKSIVFDLRGNSGGAEITLLRMLGSIFDHDITIGALKSRKESKPLVARTLKNGYTGKIVVLIDSDSASASELFARVMQLEKRGTVIGDRSAGAVMRSRQHGEQLGADTLVFYGVSITEADILMSDGSSLEKIGVAPDILLLPTPVDLGKRLDPVLSRAAAECGIAITPEKAGSLFPALWRK